MAKKVTKKPAAPVKPKTKAVKRPSQTPAIPENIINEITADLAHIKANLEDYAAHLRALDRKRLNSIGVKKEGFAQRAYRLAMDSPEFLPQYLTPERYTEDYNHYTMIQTVTTLEKQVKELLQNIDIECMDYFYTDGLDYYAAVKEAAKRRVDAAESVYLELFSFFKHKKSTNAEPTEKEQLKDAKGIIRGTKEGKFEAINLKPKLTGGIHKVIDEKFTDSAHFRESDEGSITE
jgi:hypothetical protein